MNKTFLAWYKVIFGLLGATAVITEIVVTVTRGTFNPGNFFSYFTIESNIIASIIFLLSAFFLLPQNKSPKWWPFARGAATLYMIITGAVFAVLLSGYDSTVLTAVPWDNMVLHYIIPIAILVDWLIDPPRQKLAFKKALLWLLFPLAYVCYSLVRGNITNWYPYPFLNPNKHGIIGVIVVSVCIATFVIFMTRLLVQVNKKSSR